MRRVFALAVISPLLFSPASALDRPLQTTDTREFLRLPESMQRLYVSGVLDGVYIALNGGLGHSSDSWRDCVRRVNIRRTTDEVLTLLRKDEERRAAPVTRAVADVIETRNCPK